jgi:hypothetical protein
MAPSLTKTIEANNKALEAGALGFAASEMERIKYDAHLSHLSKE